MSSRRGGRGDRGGRELPREVMVSKKFSWLLRHGAEQEGLKLGEGGYVNVADAVSIELKDGSSLQAFLTLLTSFFRCYSKTFFLFFFGRSCFTSVVAREVYVFQTRSLIIASSHLDIFLSSLFIAYHSLAIIFLPQHPF